MGYTGGSTPSPTYERLGDHTESFQVEYDPSRIGYEDLLDEFWISHDATAPSGSRQYMSAIWTHGDEQHAIASASRDRFEIASRKPVLTEVRPLGVFHPAEDHHQKYRLRADAGIFGEFCEMYPRFADVVRSTAAARVNGILGGEGCLADLVDEIGAYGLSEGASGRLLEMVAPRRERSSAR